jgi:hypothetical protein
VLKEVAVDKSEWVVKNCKFAQAINVGDMVTFTIPGLHGPMKVAGFVKRILPDGRLEVKTQQHGYHMPAPSEVTKVVR